MGRLFVKTLLLLCLGVFFATAAYSRPLKAVYLKDGGIIDCESFWKADGKVMVKVNRDVVVDLDQATVDLKKTFGRKAVKAKKKVKPRKVAVSEGTQQKAVPAPLPAGGEQAAAKSATPSQPAAAKPGSPSVAKPLPVAAAPQGAPTSAKAKPPVATTVQPPQPPQPKAVPRPPVVPKPAVSPQPGAMLGTGMIIGILVLAVALIASFWKLYEKAGEAGWKSLIPIYNMYVLVTIAGKPWWWFLLLFVPVVGAVIYLLVNLALAEKFGKGPVFGVGLFFLGFIFVPLLAFGDARYQG